MARDLSRRTREIPTMREIKPGQKVRLARRSCPRRLSWRQRNAAHPFPGNHYVAEGLRHPNLGREIGLKRKLANQSEVVCGAGPLCRGVDLAQHLLSLLLRKRCEIITAALATHATKL